MLWEEWIRPAATILPEVHCEEGEQFGKKHTVKETLPEVQRTNRFTPKLKLPLIGCSKRWHHLHKLGIAFSYCLKFPFWHHQLVWLSKLISSSVSVSKVINNKKLMNKYCFFSSPNFFSGWLNHTAIPHFCLCREVDEEMVGKYGEGFVFWGMGWGEVVVWRVGDKRRGVLCQLTRPLPCGISLFCCCCTLHHQLWRNVTHHVIQ